MSCAKTAKPIDLSFGFGWAQEAHIQSYSPGGASVPDDIFNELCNNSSAVAQMSDHGHNRHEPKSGGALPLLGGDGSPSNTMSTGPRPTSVPSGILIHPDFWPQQTWAENSGAAVPPL